MLKRTELILALSVALVVLLGSRGVTFAETADKASSPEQHRDDQREHRDGRTEKKETPSVSLAAQSVCAYNVPPGWIKTDDRWDPTKCGNPTAMVYNVWTIEQYLGRPIGSVMRVCAGDVPKGWAMIDSIWIPTSCGHPTAIVKNVMTIKKVE